MAFPVLTDLVPVDAESVAAPGARFARRVLLPDACRRATHLEDVGLAFRAAQMSKRARPCDAGAAGSGLIYTHSETAFCGAGALDDTLIR